jgi:hypothetical protein
MQEEVESTYVGTTLQSFLLSLFAGLALLLALTGIDHGVSSGQSRLVIVEIKIII